LGNSEVRPSILPTPPPVALFNALECEDEKEHKGYNVAEL